MGSEEPGPRGNPMAGPDAVVSALKRHFARTWDMWQEEIANVPDGEWTSGDVDYLIPARHLCHVVVSADFYTGDTPLDNYDWNKFFDGDWEGMPAEKLPGKEAALARLGEIRAIVDRRLGALDDEALLEAERMCPWTGKTLLDRLLYLLRHCQHHLGELHAELRRRGVKRARWK